MYAKIKDNVVIQYPSDPWNDHIGKVPLDFTSGIVEGDEYVVVKDTVPNLTNPYQKYDELTPQLIDGVWTQVWQVIDMTDTEKADKKYRTMMAFRQKRNELIQSTDWAVLPDSPLTDTEKTQMLEYRAMLRNMPNQPDFDPVVFFESNQPLPQPPKTASNEQPQSTGMTRL